MVPFQRAMVVRRIAPRFLNSCYNLSTGLSSTQYRFQHGNSKAVVGYQSIGSFHSENVEELVSIPKEKYQPPPLPFEAAPVTISTEYPSRDFMLDRSEFAFLNHGAFGAALKCGYERAQQWRFYLEQQPLRYFDRDLLPHLAYATRRLAEFCNAKPEGMALVQNATTALNAVLGGYAREHPNGKVVVWDVTYGSVKKMAAYYCQNNVVEVPFQSNYLHQLAEENTRPEHVFIQALDDELSKHSDTNWEHALLVLDHVTSNTAIHVPIDAIAKHAKQKWGMLVLVDGAHGLLANELNFDKQHRSIDFYISNAHKWLSCPRGAAMLYCPSNRLRDTILRQPAIVSHGIDDGYLSRFLWDGCRDYAAELSLPAVLDYWEEAGPQIVRQQLHATLTQGIQVLANDWHKEHGKDGKFWAVGNITLVPMTLHSPMMALVRLPTEICGDVNNPKTSAHAKEIQDYLYTNNIEAPIKCINGVLYVRVSCHIYNELHEFESLGRAIKHYTYHQPVYKIME